MKYNDALTLAVNEADLPGLVATFFPKSGARSGRGGAVLAEWRGEKQASGSLHRYNGAWLLTDHGAGQTYNAWTFLTGVAKLDEEEARRWLGLDDRKPSKRPIRQRSARPAPAQNGEAGAQSKSYQPISKSEAFAFKGMLEKGQAPVALKGRGFLKSEVDELQIAGDDGDAVIPITNPKGEIVALKRRFLKGKPRYRYEISGRGSPPWACPRYLELSERSEQVLIVEGELNAMIAYAVLNKAGYEVPVQGLPGSSGEPYLEGIEGKTCFLYLDPDSKDSKKNHAKAKERLSVMLIEAGAKEVIVMQSEEDDFCDIAGKEGREELLDILEANLTREWEDTEEAESKPEAILSEADKHVGIYTLRELRDAADRYLEGQVLIETGFSAMDAYTGGLPEVGIAVIGALPSMGKSAFIRQVLYHFIRRYQEPVLLISPDQSVRTIMRLYASFISGIPAWRVRRRLFPPSLKERFGDEDEIIAKWKESHEFCLTELTKFIKIMEDSDLDAIVNAMYKAADQGVGLYALDYLQHVEHANPNGEQVVTTLHRVLKELKLSMLAAGQLAKYKFGLDRHSGVPTLNDFEGKGVTIQAMEQCYMIYNPDIYRRKYNPYEEVDHESAGKARIFIRKNKEGPADAFFEFEWDEDFIAFR